MTGLKLTVEMTISGLVEADYDFFPEDFVKDIKQVVLELLDDYGEEVKFKKVEIEESHNN